MAKHKLKSPSPRQDLTNYREVVLPTNKIIFLYARVSTPAQLLNTSMPLQTEVFVQYLINLGWTSDLIQIIDVDAGTSGALPIALRQGMSSLYDGIVSGNVAAIAAEWEDRLFRERAQIDSNRFIEACRIHRVIIITRSMIYDFAHPQYGADHIKLFRHKVEHAAEYFNTLRKRMEIAQIQLHLTGKHATGKPHVGFCVDGRKFDETGQINSNYRTYVPLKPQGDYLNYILKRIKETNYNIKAAWRELNTVGPGFPTITSKDIPEGHIFYPQVSRRSTITNLIVPAYPSIERWITNPRLIGHWTVDNTIIILNNHEPCVDVDLFMDVFEHISSVTLFGEVNPNYIPQRSYNRQRATSYSEFSPTYAGLIFTDMHPRKKHAPVAKSNDCYVLVDGSRQELFWKLPAHSIDSVIDKLLQNRLVQTSIDEALWKDCIAALPNQNNSQIRLLENEIRDLQNRMNNLRTGLIPTVADISPQYYEEIAQQYERNKFSIAQLEAKLRHLQSNVVDVAALYSLREILALVLENWGYTSKEDRRELFKCLANYVNFNFLGDTKYYRKIEVYWRDGYVSSIQQYYEKFGIKWKASEKIQLYEMINQNLDQIKLLEAFPYRSWASILQAYARFFNNGHYPANYQGIIQYRSKKVKWAHTLEGQAYFASQNIASEDSQTSVFTEHVLKPMDPILLLSLIQEKKIYEMGFIRNVVMNDSLIDQIKRTG